MTVIVAPPQVTGQANEDWQELQAETADAPAFEPGQADRLPWPARRWVLHAIEPGTPLLRSVVLVTRGQIRLGRGGGSTRCRCCPRCGDFVWEARTWLGPVPVRGFGRNRGGAGEMRRQVLETVPVMSGSGPDITGSAAGRLAYEFVLAPAAALDLRVRWTAVDDRG
ncbi:DUF6544 family protein [Nonomuraea sp. ATR24]|uniref:DUF6544 family protein n=1 Tax=Nonomuraea TaxID=83681 RepID=UPI001C602D58|nr:DUF6544 family protein [Nonomuraea ceibae]